MSTYEELVKVFTSLLGLINLQCILATSNVITLITKTHWAVRLEGALICETNNLTLTRATLKHQSLPTYLLLTHYLKLELKY